MDAQVDSDQNVARVELVAGEVGSIVGVGIFVSILFAALRHG